VVGEMVVAGREGEVREVVKEVREVGGWVEVEHPRQGAWVEGYSSKEARMPICSRAATMVCPPPNFPPEQHAALFWPDRCFAMSS
jgi:hypothetical protein